MKKRLITLLGVVGVSLIWPLQSAYACGGQTASIGNTESGLVAWTHNDGSPLAMDFESDVEAEIITI